LPSPQPPQQSTGQVLGDSPGEQMPSLHTRQSAGHVASVSLHAASHNRSPHVQTVAGLPRSTATSTPSAAIVSIAPESPDWTSLTGLLSVASVKVGASDASAPAASSWPAGEAQPASHPMANTRNTRAVALRAHMPTFSLVMNALR